MPTIIRFTGSDVSVRVEQSDEQVLEALKGAGGEPIALEQLGGGRVYVNPATVAFFSLVDDRISPGRLDPRL